jgi:hypothetical protein
MKFPLKLAKLNVILQFKSIKHSPLVNILGSYGPLAILLYNRIEKLSKDKSETFFDLCLLNIKGDGMKFI